MKIRPILWKLFHSRKYWFVASVRQYKNTINGVEHTLEDSRCWGFYKSKKMAIQAARENWCDMNEAGYYKWVVVEPHQEGLLSIAGSKDGIWFEAMYETSKSSDGKPYKFCVGYKECETPEFAKGIANWCIS